MREQYFENRFRLESRPAAWPAEFILITGYATTGEVWTLERNEAANARLRERLQALGCWMHPITGYSIKSGHAEPGWAVEVSVEEGCALGREFLQDAIYVIREGVLWYAVCALEGRELVEVGPFEPLVDPC